jgi:hypothetical protein
MDNNRLRMVRLRPYRKGMGPVFSLTTYDTGRRDSRGSTYQRYRLCMDGRPLFEGDDYSPSPMHRSDSDAAVAGLLGFLCVTKGGVDREYFRDYTRAQIAFRDQHAEALALAGMDRFGDLL